MQRLRVSDLHIATSSGHTIVGPISFHVDEGEWLSIVGESGSGKSMTAFAVGDLLPRGVTRTAESISLDGRELLTESSGGMRSLRGAEISYVFQDYSGAFTPFIKLGDQMAETVQAHRNVGKQECRHIITSALEEVGLDGMTSRYPFQLSGGQLQRAALATAMMLTPKLLIADEPTTALDAVTQAHVLDLINIMREKHGCSVLFITHDLRCVVKHADRVAVMLEGEVIETGDTADVVTHPRQSYTRNLFAAVPRIDSTRTRLLTDEEVDR